MLEYEHSVEALRKLREKFYIQKERRHLDGKIA